MTDETQAIIEESQAGPSDDASQETEPQAAESQESEQQAETPEQTETQRKRGAQERIRQLVEEKKAEQQERARLQQEIEQLRARTQPQEQQQPKLTKPNQENYIGGMYNPQYQADYEAYIREEARQTVLNELNQQKTAAQIETKKAEIQQSEAAFIAQHPDYSEVMQDVIDSGLLSNDTVYQAIIDLPNAPEIAYKIGNDPDLLAELIGMPPHLQLLKIGSIAFQSSPKTAPTSKVSKAPPPINPIGSGTPVIDRDRVLAETTDYDTYKATRMKA